METAAIVTDLKDAIRKAGKKNRFTLVYADGRTDTKRLFVSAGGVVCEFKPRSKKYGYPLITHGLKSYNLNGEKVSRKTPAQKWSDAWNRVLKRMDSSGFNRNSGLYNEIVTARAIGYEKMKLAAESYRFGADHQKLVEMYKALDSRFVHTSDTGNEHVKTSMIWLVSVLPTVKKMRLEQYQIELIRNKMQAGLAYNEDFRLFNRKVYDNRFSMQKDADGNVLAFYSEEYKNMGNGHYYIALDETHALFVEDD